MRHARRVRNEYPSDQVCVEVGATGVDCIRCSVVAWKESWNRRNVVLFATRLHSWYERRCVLEEVERCFKIVVLEILCHVEGRSVRRSVGRSVGQPVF